MTEEEQKTLEAAMYRLREQVAQRRVLAKPCFQDFDRCVCGGGGGLVDVHEIVYACVCVCECVCMCACVCMCVLCVCALCVSVHVYLCMLEASVQSCGSNPTSSSHSGYTLICRHS